MPSAQVSSPPSKATLVMLTVIVSRDGRPVSDLTAAEVEVLDNGVAQTIEAFGHVDTVTGDSPEPPGDFVLVLDDFGTLPAGTSGAVSVGLALLNALGPPDRLSVVNTGPFALIQQLSTVRATSRATIRRFLGQRHSSSSRSEACRRSVVSLGVIEDALKVMAQQPSTRRAMLVVSDSQRVYWGEARGQKCSQARKVFDRVVAASSIANVAIYGVDPGTQHAPDLRGAGITHTPAVGAVTKVRRPSETPSGSLVVLARTTGGTVTSAAEGATDGAHQFVGDTRQYYRVVYRQPEVPRGSRNQFRKVEVRVLRPDVAVRTRELYVPD
nr:VWA domain-containing protein [Luteitalea sp.]